MATVILSKIEITEYAADIPLICPHCGADICADDALIQDTYETATWRVSANKPDEDGYPLEINYGDDGGVDSSAEGYIVGYRCATCEEQLVGVAA